MKPFSENTELFSGWFGIALWVAAAEIILIFFCYTLSIHAISNAINLVSHFATSQYT